MLAQGVDGIIVVDNGSTDGTRAALDALALGDPRVHVGTDSEPGFYQGMKTSYLAHLAWRAGADWVVPFDADEFWFAEACAVAERLRQLRSDRACVRLPERLSAARGRASSISTPVAISKSTGPRAPGSGSRFARAAGCGSARATMTCAPTDRSH